MQHGEDHFMPSLAAVIPCYRHGRKLESVAKGLADYDLKVIIVDDGCEGEDKQALEETALKYGCTLLTHEHNQGKGAAIKSALRYASEHSFEHLLQIDADGQHDLSSIPSLIRQSNEHPGALISGVPQYDASIPKGRMYGRYLTHVWVWLETLSFNLKDTMCGFRIYPVASTLKAACRCGNRMDFDTEIMVRLYWAAVPCRFVPVRVNYPSDGLSNFMMVKDNLKISLMHARLVCELPFHLPSLLKRKFGGCDDLL